MQANIAPFFENVTGTISYVVHDREDSHAAVIDPVLDYDPKAGRTKTESAQRIVDYVKAQGLQLQWIIETHAHADHLSASQFIKSNLGGKIAIGEHIRNVQAVFKKLFNLDEDFPIDGRQFDYLFKDGERFKIGSLDVEVMFVPGHTPADMAYRIGDAVFVGDTLFMPDVGTARCDFPGGDAHNLYRSIRKLLSLPEETRLFMCHDYPPKGREPAWETTVAEQKRSNIHVHDGVTEEQFVNMRQARDATLEMPVLILPSIQVNIRAGQMPPPESNGVSYFKIPLNQL
ncbi:glyoxylase-like metal-dependent hydrolase (beta-lactamase superfamily II) [Paucimonas lemoignei]|uniref:Glyoxylase-like metal-dependent hydrolase (Beta-lactamase superfamily II) n=1 Tax=Paucimonas lemoignei TaxID=29443 RepID=A0A4R3I1T5_PAULE|nr:MBL fold metallo-hydrolase [Paucimonas lemoignei]TCS39558.1 glyoxylase-like metal-dependent hydrolase (beta-lactamase superfamily II) [Paucimonas lemoignei]